MKRQIYILALLCMAVAAALTPAQSLAFDRKIKIHRPDLDSIKAETTNEKSRFYYPRLLKMFLSNDTVMTEQEYRYFYYGTLFQEDYDPYRPSHNEDLLAQIEPLYYQNSHTNDEKNAMLNYAMAELRDNPVDLVQLKNLVYVYEKKRKDNLAKIWKCKLNKLLYVIFSSGSGLSKDSPWIVVYPRQEFDIFNIYGIPVSSQTYEEPHFDHFTVGRKIDNNDNYYFDLGPVLEQYYLKHPSELDVD